MPRVRVLVVDDSVVVRRVVSDVLAGEPDIEVVGTAANGRLGLAKIDQLKPDLVTLDIEMPELNGLETLVELRRHHPRLPVIMFSTLTERGAAATLEALARGASDYVTKPGNAGSVTLAQIRVREELVPKIRALCSRVLSGAAASPASAGPRPATAAALPGSSRPVALIRADILVIGVSTGGPNALGEILPKLPADFPLPVLIVQHMPPVFTRFLAERLANTSRIKVREGVEGGLVEPGVAWIAPGNYHMVLSRDGAVNRLAINQDAPENSCRPSVDPLFRSAAAIHGNRTLALILTGMGQDGLRGAEEVRRVGGQVLAQDEATSIVWGMPGAVVQSGLADQVVPLDRVAGELVQRATVGRLPGLITTAASGR